MSYLRSRPTPGGRRERRLQTTARTRMYRQISASVAVVAFATGAAFSASADSLNDAHQASAHNSLDVVAPVVAEDADVAVVTETDEIVLDHSSVETQDPYELQGVTRVVTQGEPGSALVAYDVTYVDGIEVSRVESITVVVEQPTDEVISIGSLVIPAATPAQQGSNRALGKEMAADLYGWTGDQWNCLEALWSRESGWRHTAENKSSGAYGIPQAYPGSKMASAGDDWRTNPATQIKWGLGYIDGRYSNPCGAWAHSESKGWY